MTGHPARPRLATASSLDARHRSAEAILRPLLLAFALFLIPTITHAQGCTQCRDNTAATPPATQAAYRHAITLMAGSAGAFFVTALVLLRRQR